MSVHASRGMRLTQLVFECGTPPGTRFVRRIAPLRDGHAIVDDQQRNGVASETAAHYLDSFSTGRNDTGRFRPPNIGSRNAQRNIGVAFDRVYLQECETTIDAASFESVAAARAYPRADCDAIKLAGPNPQHRSKLEIDGSSD